MVEERSSHIQNLNEFEHDLSKLTANLEKISISSGLGEEEIKELTSRIETFNKILDQDFWNDKKFALEKTDTSIEKALNAILLFQNIRSDKDNGGKRTTDQAIISLYSALNAALSVFDKNLRDLKKRKIGQKIAKSGESKQTT